MTFWGVEIGRGQVVYDDISFLPDEFDPALYDDYLKEDLLQIVFDGGWTLDVSWRPSFDRDGAFHIWLVRDDDWETPVLRLMESGVLPVKQAMARAVAIVDNEP